MNGALSGKAARRAAAAPRGAAQPPRPPAAARRRPAATAQRRPTTSSGAGDDGLGVAGRRGEALDSPSPAPRRAAPAPALPGPSVLEFPGPGAPAPPLKTSGLAANPLSGGVANATARGDLPSPAVAMRNLVEQAQFGHLCTTMSGMHHRRAGYPFGTVVDFAADGAGHPVFALSPLAIPTRNLMEDPRCSLVMQMPGWSGLANARVTMFGDAHELPKSMQAAAAEIFHQKMATDGDQRWVSGNATYFRMNRILDIYFVGGFGTVQWVDVDEYAGARPDAIVVAHPATTLAALNEAFSEPLRRALAGARGADDAAFISIDKLGADVRVRRGGEYTVERLKFDVGVESREDAAAAVARLLGELARGGAAQ
jgi:hypothetical protein